MATRLKSKLSPKTTKLLLRIRDHILTEPKRFDMNDWVLNPRSMPEQPACNTVACIGGWATILSAPRAVQKKLATMRRWDTDKVCALVGLSAWGGEETAQKILGITNDQARALFYPGQWPQPFKALWQGENEEGAIPPPQSYTRAGIAADRIMYLITTGK